MSSSQKIDSGPGLPNKSLSRFDFTAGWKLKTLFFKNCCFQFPYSVEARFFGTTHDDLVGMLSATRLFAGCLSGIVLLVSTTGKHFLGCNIDYTVQSILNNMTRHILLPSFHFYKKSSLSKKLDSCQFIRCLLFACRCWWNKWTDI